MGKVSATIWLATLFLLAEQATATDQTQKAESAKEKAEVLEEKAASDGSKVPPTPAQLITKPQVQAVDPAHVFRALFIGKLEVVGLLQWRSSPMLL